MSNISTDTFFARPLTASIRNAFTAMAERRANARVYRQTVRELSVLTNRDLDDLGLHRADIEQVARKAAYGV